MSMQTILRCLCYSLVQKRTAPTSPKIPAIPKVDAEEPSAAPLALFAALPLAVLAPELVAVFAELDPLGEPLVLVGETVPDPESFTAVLRQLLSVPAMIVARAEKTWAPVPSFRATLKLVLDWRSTSQVKEVPVC